MKKENRFIWITSIQVFLVLLMAYLFIQGWVIFADRLWPNSYGVACWVGVFGIAFLILPLVRWKMTPEERIFKQDITGLINLKKKKLITKEDFERKRIVLFYNFLKTFCENKRRTIEYKVGILAKFKDSGVISGEEFEQGKAKILELE